MREASPRERKEEEKSRMRPSDFEKHGTVDHDDLPVWF